MLYSTDEKNQVIEEHFDRNGQQHNTKELACNVYTALTKNALQEVHIAQHEVNDNNVHQQTDEDVYQTIHRLQ